MRFERREVSEGTEFWVFDVRDDLHAALGAMWWDSRQADGWRAVFDRNAYQLNAAYENLQQRLEPALRQLAGLDPVPWADALTQVCQRFEAAGLDWWLTGSAALAARGADITPHDLDLIVAGPDSRRAGDVLLDGLIEPVVRAHWHLSDWWGRAVIGARAEWAGGITAAADEPEATDFGRTAASALETIRWRGRDIRVPPLRLQRAVSARRGLTDRVALIDRFAALPSDELRH
jgi:hypothetical protein